MSKGDTEIAESIAYIGVGSNIGNRYKNILSSEKEISNSNSTRVIQISKIYETEPVGYLDQDYFLNCVFKVSTILTPQELLKLLLEIELILKRERIIHWGPRTIDLDILFFENYVISTKNLIVPHPRLHERMFVLKPLCDLTPDIIHPVLKETCIGIAEKLKKSQSIPQEWSTP